LSGRLDNVIAVSPRNHGISFDRSVSYVELAVIFFAGFFADPKLMKHLVNESIPAPPFSLFVNVQFTARPPGRGTGFFSPSLATMAAPTAV
jgi:hypothetical protein